MKLEITIDNLKDYDAIAIEDMLSFWQFYGEVGMSRKTCFYADGDGTFRPKITVNGHKPNSTDIITNDIKIDCSGNYYIDSDSIASRLKETK